MSWSTYAKRLTDKQKEKIRARHKEGVKSIEIALMFGVHRTYVNKIIKQGDK